MSKTYPPESATLLVFLMRVPWSDQIGHVIQDSGDAFQRPPPAWRDFMTDLSSHNTIRQRLRKPEMREPIYPVRKNPTYIELSRLLSRSPSSSLTRSNVRRPYIYNLMPSNFRANTNLGANSRGSNSKNFTCFSSSSSAEASMPPGATSRSFKRGSER